MLSTYSNPLTQQQIAAIRTAAEAAFPIEACGFVLLTGEVVTCTNTATLPDTFTISATETAQYLDDALCSWHSHIQFPRLSEADIRASKALNLPYAVWDCSSSLLFWLDPSQDAGLLSRPWAYGVHDCYSAVRDWYWQQHAYAMNDYPRQYEGEWNDRGFTHFEDNFAAEGFIKLPPTAVLQRGDVLLMRIRNDVCCNHVAVLEDPAANQLYQHLVGRLSGLSTYSPYFREQTYAVLRRSA
jgi:proteasome lid subunit RPN8/RPN11